MTDIDALMKRCQIGVPRGPNAYDQLHSILAECYGAMGVLSARPPPDCRTCKWFHQPGDSQIAGCISHGKCVNGNKYQPTVHVQLWGME